MLLVAQRVRSRSGNEGINAFWSRHTATENLVPVVEMLDMPGRLEWQRIAVPPPGNAVRSFIDIALREQVTNAGVQAVISSLVSLRTPPRTPLLLVGDLAAVRGGCEQGLEPQWQRELAALLAALFPDRA